MRWASSRDAAAACELAVDASRVEASRLRSVLNASRSQIKNEISGNETDRLRRLLGSYESAKHQVETTPVEQGFPCDINSIESSRDASSSEQSEESFVLIDNMSAHCSSASSQSSSSWSKVSGLATQSKQPGCGDIVGPDHHVSGMQSSGSGTGSGRQRPKKLSGRTRQRLAKWRREVRQRTPSPDCFHAAIKQHFEGCNVRGWPQSQTCLGVPLL